MAKKKDLERLRESLHARTPLIGGWRQRRAARTLHAMRDDPAVVPLLIEALDTEDAAVAAQADSALRSLTERAAFNALCAAWVEGRDPRLADILIEKRYVATTPLRSKVLSGLKAGAIHAIVGEAHCISELITALDDDDEDVRRNADAALRSLTRPAAVNALCGAWVNGRDPRLADILVEKEYLATEPPRIRVLSGLKTGAVPTLAGEANVAPELIAALEDRDDAVSQNAALALGALTHPASINALCAAWVEKRDPRLAGILVEQEYVATEPPRPRVLSGLKTGASLMFADEVDVIPELVAALDDEDETVANNAALALKSLTLPAAINALCTAWVNGRDSRLAEILVERQYVATEPLRIRVLSGLKIGASPTLAGEPNAIAELIAALGDQDDVVSRSAVLALGTLNVPASINALCAAWVENRDPQLEVILLEAGYVATEPLNVRILSALLVGREIDVQHPNYVPYFVRLLSDKEESIREGAERCLKQLKPGPVQDALCDAAIQEPGGPAAKLCERTRIRPRDHERACLFLFVTRQFDAFFAEVDPNAPFQTLRLEFDRADPKLRGKILAAYRSGDNRCTGFLEVQRKTLAELSPQELQTFIDSWLKHEDWPRVFQAVLELPLRHSWPLLPPLQLSGWQPESHEMQSVLRDVLSNTIWQAVPTTNPSGRREPESSLFMRWLNGAGPDVTNLDESELLERLKTAAPPQGVAIVGAMAKRGDLSDAARKAIQEHRHWLVRLAWRMAQPLAHDGVEDANYWIRELAEFPKILDIWPGSATPHDLEQLTAAPAEAFKGPWGALRTVLRTVIAHRLDSGIFVPMEIEAESDAAEFEVEE